MAWTQEQLAAIEDAIGKGVLEVRYRDRTVKYRSLAEMMTLRETMRRELGLAERNVRLLAKHSKGTV